MFDLKAFVMQILSGMKDVYPEWQVMQFALSYYGRGWIGDEELAEVQGWYMPAPEATEPDATEPDA